MSPFHTLLWHWLFVLNQNSNVANYYLKRFMTLFFVLFQPFNSSWHHLNAEFALVQPILSWLIEVFRHLNCPVKWRTPPLLMSLTDWLLGYFAKMDWNLEKDNTAKWRNNNCDEPSYSNSSSLVNMKIKTQKSKLSGTVFWPHLVYQKGTAETLSYLCCLPPRFCSWLAVLTISFTEVT